MTNPTPSDARALVAAADVEAWKQGCRELQESLRAANPKGSVGAATIVTLAELLVQADEVITQLADALDAATERAEARGVVVEAAREFKEWADRMLDGDPRHDPRRVQLARGFAGSNLAAALAALDTQEGKP